MRKVSSLSFALTTVRVLTILNWACLALFGFALALTFVAENQLLANLAEDGVDSPALQLPAIRTMLVVGALMVFPVHLILTRLRDMIEGVRRGEAFTLDNVGRLKAIAWALLLVQVLDLAFGLLTIGLEDAPGWSPSVTGWLAVILLFVLAHVFEQGAAMRDELDATV